MANHIMLRDFLIELEMISKGQKGEIICIMSSENILLEIHGHGIHKLGSSADSAQWMPILPSCLDGGDNGHYNSDFKI